MKFLNFVLIISFLFLFFVSQAQDPYCNEDVCGALDPSWQLSGNQTVACEGETFFLRSSQSTPYNNIDSYTWILTNVITGDELIHVIYTDTTPLEFTYIVDDGLACQQSKINIEVRLVVTSPACANGESCRYTAEPLTILFKPRANFTTEQLVCINEPVSFTDESCNASSYAWDFDGDGVFDSTDSDPTYSYSTPGVYTVSQKAINGCGADIETKVIEVVGIPEAEIDLGPSDGVICAPDFLTLKMNANEWVTSGASGFFQWKISPSYTNMNGDWCFVRSDYNGSGEICWDDAELDNATIDSLLHLKELPLYFTGPGEYEVTLEYGNVCETKTLARTIYVNEPVSISGATTLSGCDSKEVCFDDIGVMVNGDYESLEWTFTNGSASGSTDLDFGCVTFGSSGVMVLNVDANMPCPDVSATINVNVIATQSVSIADPNPNVICQNAGLIELFPSVSGGSYMYDGSLATFISGNMLDPSSLSAGEYTVTYILSDNPDCPAEDAFSFSIQGGPEVSLGENASVCESVTNYHPIIDSYGGDIDAWSWQVFDNMGNSIASSNESTPSFSIDMPGIYSIVVELSSDECGSILDTSELIIQANIDAVIQPLNNPYCQGSSQDTLSASPLGGTWSGDGIVDSDNGIFDPSILEAGTYSVIYTIINGACSSTSSESVIVVASENVTVKDTFFCILDVSGELLVSPTGGQFSGDGITDPATGLFSPALADIGNNEIVYEYVDSNNCEVVKNFTVEVDTIPDISKNDTVFVCIGNDDVDLLPLVNIDTHGEEGSLILTGPGIINSNLGIFNGGALEVGYYTVIVDFQARSCGAQDSFVIELAEMPELLLSPDSTVCVTDGTLVLMANISGGLWSSTNCTIIPETGEVDLELNGESECVFQYTLSANTSCEQSKAVNVTILDLANDLVVPPNTSICYRMGLYTIPNFSPENGIWSGSGIVDAAKGVIDVSLLSEDSSYVYTYCIESDEIECEACKQTTITIEALPKPSFSLDGSPCQNQSFATLNSTINAVSYLWDFGDGSQSSLFEPSHIYTSPGSKLITLMTKTDFGCADTITQEVYVTPPPILNLSVKTEEGCAPLVLEYTNNSTGENVEQYWIIGGVDTLFEVHPLIVLDGVSTDSLVTVELIIKNDCALLSQIQEVLVHPYPIVDFGITDDEGCSPDTVFFMNATVGLPEEFLWTFGNGNVSSILNPPFQIYTSPDDSISTYTISLYASNECGADTLEKQIVVYPNNIDAFFEVDTLSGCPPLAVKIKNYATPGAIVTYDFGDGGTGSIADTTYIYTDPGKYVITQYASLCGTDSIKSDTITVFPVANVDFELPEFACLGDTVYFINLSSGGVVSEWDFGDGASSGDSNPYHIFASSGLFDVSLTVRSTYYNCPKTVVKSILVPAAPQASFGAAPAEACVHEAVLFQNNSIGAQNYEWDFGDMSGSDEKNPTHIYTKNGVFVVSLKVFDEFGCAQDTSLVNMIIHPNPTSLFELSSESICQFYDTLKVINTSVGAINSLWNINGDFYSDQLNEISLVFDDFGTKQLEHIAISSFGCKDTTSTFVEVLPSPIAKANLADTSGCEGLMLDFITLSQNTNWVQWIFEGGNLSTDSISQHTFLDYGSYSVKLVAGNTNGCPNDTISTIIEVFPRAQADFEVTPFDSCGVPLTIEMMNTSNYSSDYFWDFGNGVTSDLSDPLVNYEEHGKYKITLIASNIFGCPDTTYSSITAYPEPVADFNLPNLKLCEGDTLTIINTSIDANGYDWFVNNEEFEDFPLVIYESGVYSLSLVASYDSYCLDTFSVGNIIAVYESPIADFLAFVNEDEQIIGDVRFLNSSINADQFYWEFGDGKSSIDENPTHEYDVDGPNIVSLFSYNNNFGLFQCVDIKSVLIDYELINTFFVPNAMSPEQNFGNVEVSLFKPKGIGIKEYELSIYSPWGDKVATLNQVLNGEPIDFWDGTFDGQIVPQGAYLWKASIKYNSGHQDFKTGKLTIVR